MRKETIKIVGGAYGCETKIFLGKKDISRYVKSYTLNGAADDVNSLTLEMIPEHIEVDVKAEVKQ